MTFVVNRTSFEHKFEIARVSLSSLVIVSSVGWFAWSLIQRSQGNVHR